MNYSWYTFFLFSSNRHMPNMIKISIQVFKNSVSIFCICSFAAHMVDDKNEPNVQIAVAYRGHIHICKSHQKMCWKWQNSKITNQKGHWSRKILNYIWRIKQKRKRIKCVLIHLFCSVLFVYMIVNIYRINFIVFTVETTTEIR